VSLSIETSAPAGGVVEITPRGEIDVDTAHEVREAVAAVLSAGRPDRIELDMHLVTFLDSIGISAMVAAFQLASVGGVQLVVTRPSRFVHRQLWVTGLLGLFGAPDPHVVGASRTVSEPGVRTA
jgi:anti-anti-sigma factor